MRVYYDGILFDWFWRYMVRVFARMSIDDEASFVHRTVRCLWCVCVCDSKIIFNAIVLCNIGEWGCTVQWLFALMKWGITILILHLKNWIRSNMGISQLVICSILEHLLLLLLFLHLFSFAEDIKNALADRRLVPWTLINHDQSLWSWSQTKIFGRFHIEILGFLLTSETRSEKYSMIV